MSDFSQFKECGSDGQMDQRKDGRTDGPTDNKPTFRDAGTHLKTSNVKKILRYTLNLH